MLLCNLECCIMLHTSYRSNMCLYKQQQGNLRFIDNYKATEIVMFDQRKSELLKVGCAQNSCCQLVKNT